MSEDDEFEVPEGCILKEDAQAMAVDAAAAAINEFLYQASLGYTPEVAFERAVDGETNTALRVPSNLSIKVIPAEEAP